MNQFTYVVLMMIFCGLKNVLNAHEAEEKAATGVPHAEEVGSGALLVISAGTLPRC